VFAKKQNKVEKSIFVVLLAVVLLTVGVTCHRNAITTLNPGTDKTILDMHVHVAGLGYGNSGCFINKEMRANFRFPFYLWAMDVTEEELRKNGDKFLIGKISQKITESKTVDKAVVLAMDGYVTEDGVFDSSKTQIYVPNKYLMNELQYFDNLYWGASVNPNRKDATHRLKEAYRGGAVLIKWLPSIMNIDPADKRHIPFYKTLVELKLPLLTHTGKEKSFANAVDKFSDPLRLKLPLDLGVTVIAAHIATTGKSEGQDNFERILPMFQNYPNLYADISSLTQFNKIGYLPKALAEPGVAEHLLYGTDWPLQFVPLISPWYHIGHISLQNAWQVSGVKNQWDRDVALKMAHNVPVEIFNRAVNLLKR